MTTAYKPTAIPIKKLDWESLIPRIGMAQAAVARFDGILQAMVSHRLPTTSGEGSEVVRHMWRTNADCSPRTADNRILSARCGTQQVLRATNDREMEGPANGRE